MGQRKGTISSEQALKANNFLQKIVSIGTTGLVGGLLGLRFASLKILSSSKHPYPAIFLGLTLVPNRGVLKDLVLAALVKSELRNSWFTGRLLLGSCLVLRGSTHTRHFHPKSFIKVRLSRGHKGVHHNTPILSECPSSISTYTLQPPNPSIIVNCEKKSPSCCARLQISPTTLVLI